MEELQAQVDAFDHVYNTERGHQGLPGRVTPLTAWEATPKAQAPRPRPLRPLFERPDRTYEPARRTPLPRDLPAGTTARELSSNGTFSLDGVTYMVEAQHAFVQVLITTDEHRLIVTDLHGEVLAERTRPERGTRYVGNGRPKGPRPQSD